MLNMISRVNACRRRCLLPVLWVTLGSIPGLGFHVATPDTFKSLSLGTGNRIPRCSTILSAKLWDRLEIEEDPEPFWYLLNCIAGLELELLKQCRATCKDMPDVVKFVVPTERKTRSHGANRMVTEDKTKYGGYVFAKLRLCPEVYEAIQTLDLCRSWMGTVNQKGHKKLPPAPVALNELEVENFGLEDLEFEEEEEVEESDVIVDEGDDDESSKDNVDQEALTAYLGLKVEDMVKVTKSGNFFSEDGIVRRLKDGKILVRFFTYGTMFEEWMDPGDVRALSNVEVLRGLQGPSRPVTQRDFDGPSERGYSSRSGDRPYDNKSLRQNLMTSVQGNRGMRNRRRDRSERGDQYKRDAARRDEQRERENWKWYQENRGPNPSRESMGESVPSNTGYVPPSQRQIRREKRKQQQSRDFEKAIDGGDDWSAFVSQPPSDSSTPPSEEDSFFESLMSDLSQDLSSTSSRAGNARGGGKDTSSDADDDFFASLTSELSEELDTGKQRSRGTQRENKSDDDDFFNSLTSQLSEELDTGKQVSRGTPKEDDDDDFFNSLTSQLSEELDMGKKSSRGAQRADPSDEDDFFNSLTSQLSEELDAGEKSSSGGSDDDDFFSALESQLRGDPSVEASPRPETSSSPADDDDDLDELLAELMPQIGDAGPTEDAETQDFMDNDSDEFGASSMETKKPNESKQDFSADKADAASASDFTKLTVPVLKDMLRERGLKISGRKAELIERLKQH